MPRRPPPELLEFLAPYDAEVRALALALRDFVLAQAPSLNEVVYDAYLEGTGKRIRHIKVKSRDDLKRPNLKRYLRAAIRQAEPGPGGGKTVVRVMAGPKRRPGGATRSAPYSSRSLSGRRRISRARSSRSGP
jgi:hypothetical protein